MTLKPENKALVERICGGDWQRPGALDKLLDAARSEGDVSNGAEEPVAWRVRAALAPFAASLPAERE